MSDRIPLMPKATAVWLVENTSLTFAQVAELCGLHVLEVKGIADGDVATGIKGMDPISTGQLTREEIRLAEADPARSLHLSEPKVALPPAKSKKGPRYTPVSRRHDRPNAVLWLIKNHAELKDSQIMRLVGTTKPTIAQVRERTHWNSTSLVPQDPVTLGLCTQIELDAEVKKGARRLEKDRKDGQRDAGGTLLPTAETTGVAAPGAPQPDIELVPAASVQAAEARQETPAEEDARVLAHLKQMSGAEQPRSDEGER